MGKRKGFERDSGYTTDILKAALLNKPNNVKYVLKFKTRASELKGFKTYCFTQMSAM